MGLKCRSLHVLTLALGIGCGPSVANSGDSGSGEPTTEASGTSSSTSGNATAIATTTTAPPLTSTTSGRESGTLGSSSDSSSGDPGPQPTAGGCEDPIPGDPPPTPRGCDPIALLDNAGDPIPDSLSGLVACPEDGALDDAVFSIFRTGAVACPFSNGECACDADCPRGQDCICSAAGSAFGDPANRCLPADCTSDADCDGGRCRANVLFCGSYGTPVGFRCTSPEDDCDSHTTCIEQGEQYCVYDETVELFTCSPGAICE